MTSSSSSHTTTMDLSPLQRAGSPHYRSHVRSRLVLSLPSNSGLTPETVDSTLPSESQDATLSPSNSPLFLRSPPSSLPLTPSSEPPASPKAPLPPSSTLQPPTQSCLRSKNAAQEQNLQLLSILPEPLLTISSTSITTTHHHHVTFTLPPNHKEHHGPCPRSSAYRCSIVEMLERCRMEYAETSTTRSGQRTGQHVLARKEERVEEPESEVEVEHDEFVGQATTSQKIESSAQGQGKEWWEIDPDAAADDEERDDSHKSSDDDESKSDEENSSDEEDDDDDDSSEDDDDDDDEEEDENESNGFGYQLRRC